MEEQQEDLILSQQYCQDMADALRIDGAFGTVSGCEKIEHARYLQHVYWSGGGPCDEHAPFPLNERKARNHCNEQNTIEGKITHTTLEMTEAGNMVAETCDWIKHECSNACELTRHLVESASDAFAREHRTDTVVVFNHSMNPKNIYKRIEEPVLSGKRYIRKWVYGE